VLLLAKRLTSADGKKDAERIYRKLWDTRTASEERQVRIAALAGLAEVCGNIKDIFAAMQVDEPQIRAVAIDLARALPGQDVTMTCVEAMKKATGVERANLLALLGGRADAVALAAVLAMFDDADELVRIAAMRAAAAIGGKDAAEALVVRVTTKTGNDRAAAADALSRMRGPESAVAMAPALAASAVPDVKMALLGAFAARRLNDNSRAVTAAVGDADPAVRLAAIKAVGAIGDGGEFPPVVACLKQTKDAAEFDAAEKALVAACLRHKENPVADQVAAALPDAAPANTVAMMRVLGTAGTTKALAAVVANTTSANADVKDAAVHALAEWRAKEGAAPLLEVARSSDNAAHKILAVRGAVRLTSRDMSPEERMKILPEALKLATRPEEKREAIAALSRLQTAESLQAVAPYLDDDAVKEEAAMAVVQIAEPLAKQSPDAVRDAVAKALKVTKNDRVRSTAERILGQDKK
jgi:HEAT repeat protein